MLIIALFLIFACQVTKETTNNSLTDPDSEHEQVEVFYFDDVEYLFLGYKVTFDEAYVICLNFKAQLAVLNTKEKADFVAKAMTSTLELGEFWIGAQSDNEKVWYWGDKNKKLTLDRTFYGDVSVWDSSGFVSNNNTCLTIYRKRHSIPSFVPLQCSKKRPFICQRELDRFGIKAKEVDVIKVDDEEYTLYSAKATWAEAVVQCRQKGLQIAEVKSKKVAQAVATYMLRTRPDAMENAWIGGYLKNDEWEWVTSSNKITVNELWSNDTKLSTGCLLLDRHVCEDPIYVSAKCDRKRHILCQKPSMKLISKSPIPIEVDGCQYWIGFYPLEWLDARRSCQAINASLVILDSPQIIDHMMNLMVDYKEELRHIWTDGYRRENNSISGGKISHGIWYWVSTGDRIPESGFIPWCPVYFNTKNENCLNLDRENYKTPVVYGLSCKKNQTYVCQPWKGHCISHRVQEDFLKNSEFLNLYSSLANMKPVKTPAIALSQNSSKETEENVSHVYEDISNMKIFHSTESYYTSSVSYSTPQQVTYLLEKTTQSINQEISARFNDEKIVLNDKGKSDNEKEDEKVNRMEVNETNSQNLITEFFSPLIQFTLPSLPQFGIRVVSAEEMTPKSEDKQIFSESPKPKATTKTVATSAKVIDKTSKNKNKGSVKGKKTPKAKSKKPIPTGGSKIKYLPTTTANVESVSNGGLYGDDIDYYDTLSSKATKTIESKQSSYDYEKLLKSLNINETLSSVKNSNIENDTSNNDVSAILQRILGEEFKLMKQSLGKNSSSNKTVESSVRKSVTNVYPGRVSEQKNKIQNLKINQDHPRPQDYSSSSIQPYYAFEAPLKVELFDDGSGVSLAPISPSYRTFDQNGNPEVTQDKSKLQTTENSIGYFDINSKKFDPYDKDSMLQLGRFLKDMFVGKNPNAQTVDFNLIARQNLPEAVMQAKNNQSWIQKNYIQRDTKAQNEDFTQITTTTSFPPRNANQDSTLCQKEVKNVKRSNSESVSSAELEPEYLQQPCKEVPVLLPVDSFRSSRMPSDISSENTNENINENKNENENGNINYKSVENNVEKNKEESLFNIFKNLVKGIRIDIKEAQLKNYVKKFVREKLPNPEQYDFGSGSGSTWHKAFKNILNSLNGTAIRFHGERVQLRLGSFEYKKKSRPTIKLVSSVQGRKPATHQTSNYQTTKTFDKNPVYKKEKTHSLFEGSKTQDGTNEDQAQVQKVQIPWSSRHTYKTELEENYSKGTTDMLKHKTDFTEHNSQPIKNKLSARRTKQKSTTEDRADSQTWSYFRNERQLFKKLKQIEEKDSMSKIYRGMSNRMFSPTENWSKVRTLNAEEDINNAKNLANEVPLNNDEQPIKTANKLAKKSISEANEEDPFPDFPVINFDMKRAEDSIESGFDPIRVSRAVKNGESEDKSSVVSVYIVLKHQDNTDGQNNVIPILELHVRMPADSKPRDQKPDSDFKTRSISNDQIPDSEVSRQTFRNPVSQTQKIQTTEGTRVTNNEPTQKSQNTQNLQKLQIQKIPKRMKMKNQNHLNNSVLYYGQNHTDLKYEKANDFLKGIINNVTNSKSVTDLKRKRQLLYLALKYLRHVTDERLKKQSRKSEDPQHSSMKDNKEIQKFLKNPNFRFSEMQNFWQPIIYPGVENRPMVFNPVENELNPRPGMFNQMPNFNYNTRRYDDMPYPVINPRIRRNLGLPAYSRSRLFFVDHHQGLNRN